MPAPKGNSNAKGNKGGGRKTVYKKEYAALAFNYCLLGAIDQDLAQFFGVSEKTIENWKNRHVEFSTALREGKMQANARVARALFHRCIGYEHEEVHVSTYQGQTIQTPLTKHYPPDPKAIEFWMINRTKNLPEHLRWKQKIDHEHGGKDGNPIEFRITRATREDNS